MDRTKDKWGESFATCVNGVNIFAMGADYIPEDHLLGRVTPETTRALLEKAVFANFNSIRVWGGGYYPDDWFYDMCDEMGLVVWQDFMFACAVYDLTPEFEANITAEFIDDQTFDHLSLIFFEKLHRAIQLRKNAATIDISRKKNRRLCHLCHSHVDNVFAFQIDLSRTPRTFNDDNVIFLCKFVECLHNIRHQFFLIFEIIPGTHCSEDFPVDNYLRANIIGRFQKNRVHKNRWFCPCRLSLHDLRPSHLKTFARDKRIQCHILGFKRSYPIPVLMKNPAQSCRKKTFSCIGHRTLYHDRFCHL